MTALAQQNASHRETGRRPQTSEAGGTARPRAAGPSAAPGTHW